MPKAVGDGRHRAAQRSRRRECPSVLPFSSVPGLPLNWPRAMYTIIPNTQLGHGVRVLAGRCSSRPTPALLAAGAVDVVVTGAGSDDELELLGGGDHLGVDLVATHDQRVGVGDGGVQRTRAVIRLDGRGLIAGFS